ncbi:hypothetical protein ACQCSX_13120 [Pseudarthrobacter sp. P1]|uniref:hypothetical protein n=1 Tax=Pseudarthrobacter sp. P1 TaxID=3418418 RepID=UPI003CEDFFCE
MSLIVVPLMAAIAMALIVGAILRDSRPTACPAIGWIDGVDISLTGNAAKVASLTICDGAGCVPGGVSASAAPTFGTGSVTRQSDTIWHYDVGMNNPEWITVQAADAAGAILAQKTFMLNWKRVGGSEQCGGPAMTDPVVLAIP